MYTFYKISVKGIVQGVGFRPFIYREAVKAKIKGYIKSRFHPFAGITESGKPRGFCRINLRRGF